MLNMDVDEDFPRILCTINRTRTFPDAFLEFFSLWINIMHHVLLRPSSFSADKLIAVWLSNANLIVGIC